MDIFLPMILIGLIYALGWAEVQSPVSVWGWSWAESGAVGRRPLQPPSSYG